MYNNSTHLCKKPTLEILKLWKSRKQSAQEQCYVTTPCVSQSSPPHSLACSPRKTQQKNNKKTLKERADREDLKITVCIRTSPDRALAYRPCAHLTPCSSTACSSQTRGGGSQNLALSLRKPYDRDFEIAKLLQERESSLRCWNLFLGARGGGGFVGEWAFLVGYFSIGLNLCVLLRA